MVTRRRFLVGSVAGGIAVVAGVGGVASARQPKPGPRKKPRFTRVAGKVYLGLSTPLGAPPGGALRTRGGAVFSVANANDAYVAVMALDAAPSEGPVLVLERGREVTAESWGTGFGDAGAARGSASWRVTREKADEIARLWKVKRRDRVPLGAGLVARWKPKGVFVVGKKAEMVLTLENAGTAPVWFNTGGRQRGARDNRFAFAATPASGGAALPVLDAPDFGGIGAVRPLEPGATLERVEDVTKWVTFDRPGTYRVSCRYELELTTGTDGGRWPEHGHELWDWAADDVVDVNVG
jgi:hypothetical protein